MKYLFLFSLALLLPLSLAGRTFTNAKGRTIVGELLEVKEGKAHIEVPAKNQKFWIPVNSLSPDDQEFIKKWAEEQKTSNKEAEPPKSYKPSFRDSTEKLKKTYNLEDNFDAEWPSLVSIDLDIEIEVVSEDDEFVYHSPNYAFISDVKLSKNVVKKFAALFEATRQFCKELPVSTIKARVPDGSFRYRILLFETKESYVNAGAPPQSAGVFKSGTQEVLVPLTSLGVKKVGSSYMYDYKGTNKTLPHEITHQLTDREYYSIGSRGWFTEGLAEYVGVTDYRSGKFMVRSNRKEIIEYVTAYGDKNKGGRALGETIQVGDLKTFFMQPYDQFVANAQLNYGVGLLITYYYFHLDGGGDRVAITNFLKALKEGKKGEQALEALLNGRSYEEMEEDIAKGWKSKGVKLVF